MGKFRKILAIALALVAVLSVVHIVGADSETPVEIRVASLKGPTTMGLVKLIEDDKTGASANDYTFTLAGTADEIVPLLARGELDIALIPANLASILYKNTEGAIRVAAINTLGVLYVVETGDAIHAIDDLKGITLYSTGKGTTPEFALGHVLKQNGIDPDADLTIEYKSEATEVAAALASDAVSAALLPQPFVTAAMAQNDRLRVALSLTDEWQKVDDQSALITGVVVARAAFIDEQPDAFAAFLGEYAASTQYVNENPAEAGVWIAEAGIVPKAELAEAAIPASNIVCITGEDMKVKLSGYLAALHGQNPQAVGGELPDDAFYFIP